MMTLLTAFVLLLNLLIALRLIWFERGARRHSHFYACLAALMIAVTLGHCVGLAFLGHRATPYELLYGLVFLLLVVRADGNVAKLWAID